MHSCFPDSVERNGNAFSICCCCCCCLLWDHPPPKGSTTALHFSQIIKSHKACTHIHEYTKRAAAAAASTVFGMRLWQQKKRKRKEKKIEPTKQKINQKDRVWARKSFFSFLFLFLFHNDPPLLLCWCCSLMSPSPPVAVTVVGARPPRSYHRRASQHAQVCVCAVTIW